MYWRPLVIVSLVPYSDVFSVVLVLVCPHVEAISDVVLHYAVGAFDLSPIPTDLVYLLRGIDQRILANLPRRLQVGIVFSDQVVRYVLGSNETMFVSNVFLYEILEHFKNDRTHLVEVLKQIGQWIQQLPLGFREYRYVVNDVVVRNVGVVVGQGNQYEHEFALPLLHRGLFALFLEIDNHIPFVVGNVRIPKGQ